MNMFFWHFEARNSPGTAPLVVILNGGPGTASSSLPFIMNGPCMFANYSFEPTVNPNSFNEHASLLYVDQPISTGFSYGSNFINSSDSAAHYLWRFLQAFIANFQQFKDRDLAILTVSYGGHTGPALANEILEKNSAIRNGTHHGSRINLGAVGLVNAWIDAEIQTKGNIEFAHENEYQALINKTEYDQLLDTFENKVLPKIRACEKSDTVDACLDANTAYEEEIEDPIHDIAYRFRDLMYIGTHHRAIEGYPARYLSTPSVRKALGARRVWDGEAGMEEVLMTGDAIRSFLPDMANVLDSDVDIVMMTGDADYVCSWRGTLNAADAVPWAYQHDFRDAKIEPYNVTGVQRGTYKRVENFSYIKVHDAGHNVPLYQRETAVQIFQQMLTRNVTST